MSHERKRVIRRVVEIEYELPDSFGEWLKVMAKNAGLRQDDVAQMTGISHGTVNNFMNGNTQPRVRDVARIVRALSTHLGMSFEDLWGDVGAVLVLELQKEAT